MVLQPGEIPAGLQPLGNEFSTNAETISGIGLGPTLEQLEKWGRVLGYKSEFQTAAPPSITSVAALSTSVSVYKSATGATDSLTDREEKARSVDWQQSHSDLEEFQQTEPARELPVDQALWLRFTGYQELRPGVRNLVIDDQIAFRVGEAWGFLGVISTAAEGETDRDILLPEVEVLVRTQIEHMRNALASAFSE